jgi:hypothetical protein
MTDPDTNPFADGSTAIVTYGGAKPNDTDLVSKVHCVNNGIFDVLKRRERLRRKRKGIADVDCSTDRTAQEPLDRRP